MFAGWTITAFLWKLSAWLLLLNIGEILTIFSYAMATNFLESMIIMLLLLSACILLPANVLRDEFVVRGTILSVGLIGSLMVFVGSQMQFGIERGLLLLIAPLLVFILTAFLLLRASKLHRVRSIAVSFSDRAVVFLFVLVPLFAVASIYVILRNVS